MDNKLSPERQKIYDWLKQQPEWLSKYITDPHSPFYHVAPIVFIDLIDRYFKAFIEESKDGPEASNTDSDSVASHSCTSGNPIEQACNRNNLLEYFKDFFTFHNPANKDFAGIDELFNKWYDERNINKASCREISFESIIRIIGSNCEHDSYCQEKECQHDGRTVCKVDQDKAREILRAFEKYISDKNDERNATQQKPNSSTTADSIRDKFFKECVEEVEVWSNQEPKKLKQVWFAPDDLFEWFKPYLHNPSLRWVKASERLPKEDGTYYVKMFTKMQGGYLFKDTDWFNGKEFDCGFNQVQRVSEWLEESGESQ